MYDFEITIKVNWVFFFYGTFMCKCSLFPLPIIFLFRWLT